MSVIGLYKNSPTDGGVDGGLVCDSNPVIIPPIVAGDVSAGIKLALRCDDGYRADGDIVTVSTTGTNAERWAFAPDDDGSEGTYLEYGASLEFTNLATPAPAATPAETGGTLAAGDYSYRVTALNGTGETLPCAAVLATTTGETASVALEWDAVTDASSYKIYGRTPEELLMATVTDPEFLDDGSLTPDGALPVSSTAQVADRNRIFWAKAKAETGDGVTDDTTVLININALGVVAL